MLKSMRLLPICALVGLLSGCNAGTETGNVSITATVTQGTCNYMESSAECQITLSYNKGNESGLVVSYTPSPLPSYIDSNLFNTGVTNCNNTITYSTNNSGTCQPIRVKYIGNGSGGTNLMFLFGGKSSQTISVTGWNI